MGLELRQLARDAAVTIHPPVMLANALAAFALNLVRMPTAYLYKLLGCLELLRFADGTEADFP